MKLTEKQLRNIIKTTISEASPMGVAPHFARQTNYEIDPEVDDAISDLVMRVVESLEDQGSDSAMDMSGDLTEAVTNAVSGVLERFHNGEY